MAVSWFLAGSIWLLIGADAEPAQGRVDLILQRYFSIPASTDDPEDPSRSQRMDVLSELGPLGNEAVEGIARALPRVTEAWRRAELAEALSRDIRAPAAASLLRNLLKDPDARVRHAAIGSLGNWAHAVPIDNERRLRGIKVPPRVSGLVPSLVEALRDPDPLNRREALGALTGTCDPAALLAIHGALLDPDEGVRFTAACFLGLYGDPSGLPVLKARLNRCRQAPPEFRTVQEPEMLFTSLERITGKSFGKIPMDPMLCSSFEKAEQCRQRHRELLEAWAAWFAH